MKLTICTRVIKETNLKSDTQTDSLKKDITVINEIITSLQKDLKESNLKYEILLSQHKKELLDKDKEIDDIVNNLNSINT